jgi:hypothetical protein
MSGFEFVLVLYSIIVGLGISEILSGFGEQIRARHRMSVYPLQIALSFLLMFYGTTFLWGFWTFRDIVWTFPLYISMAAMPMIISLASRVVRVDTAIDAPSPKEQYFHSARPVYLLLALVPAVLVALSFASALGDSVRDRPDLVQLTAVRMLTSIGVLYLAWSQRAIVHWIGIGALFLLTVQVSARLTVRAIEGGL